VTKNIYSSIILITALAIGGCSSDSSSNNKTSSEETPVDTEAPQIALQGMPVIYLQKGMTFIEPGFTAVDNIDGSLTSSVKVNDNLDNTTAGRYQFDYTVEDSAGNKATATRQVVVVYSLIKQTGQQKSYDSNGDEAYGLRDDGYYQLGMTPNYHHNTNGSLSDYTTGLIWQDDQVIKQNYEDALGYCDRLSLAGIDDWRVPSIEELATIVKHDSEPLTGLFTQGDTAANYWSSTEVVGDDTTAWVISFSSGTSGKNNKSTLNNTRCVSGNWNRSDYMMTRDDTKEIVFDAKSGLEWLDNVTPPVKNWTDALNYCSALTTDGGNWRLPNYNELFFLLERSKSTALDPLFQKSADNFFWSATTFDGDKSNALIVKPTNGDDKWFSKTSSFYLRCVRTKDMDMSTIALQVIQRYAESDGATQVPQSADYATAGITGVSASNIADVNLAIKDATIDEVDTTAAVQEIVNDVITANLPLPSLSVANQDGSSGILNVTLSSIDTTQLTKVRIYRNSSTDIATKILWKEITVTQNSEAVQDTNLAGCHTYSYWVEACSDQTGNELCRINTLQQSATTVPDAPQDIFTYAKHINDVNIHWDNNDDDGCTVKYHIYKRSTESGSFTQINEVEDIIDGTSGATEFNVAGGVYMHYRVQAEDANGDKSSLSCSVKNGYPQYGVSTAQDSCRAAVGYTWGDKPFFPWASWNGYSDKVVFTWDDVVLELNNDGTVKSYANDFDIRYKIGTNSWSGYYRVQDENFLYNGKQYQQIIVPDDIPDLSTVPADTTIAFEITTYYYYDTDGDGTNELVQGTPVTVTGKTLATSGTASTLGSAPSVAASTYFPNMISVLWTSSTGATSYKLYVKDVSAIGYCPTDSTNPISDGYSVLLNNTTSTGYDHMVSWKKYCYRVQACNSSGCTVAGEHAYGNSTGN